MPSRTFSRTVVVLMGEDCLCLWSFIYPPAWVCILVLSPASLELQTMLLTSLNLSVFIYKRGILVSIQ